MKYLKYVILILAIVIIIIIIALLKLIQNEYIEDTYIPDPITISTKLLDDENTYFYVKGCIDKTVYYANENDKVAIYNILNKEYIEKNNITQENVLDVTKLNNMLNYKIKDMYTLAGVAYESYYISCTYDNNPLYLNVNFDWNTKSFDLEILSKETFDECLKITIDGNTDYEEKTIEKNDYNFFTNKVLSKSGITEKYLLDYIEKAVETPEEAYELLDEQYRKAKFDTLDDFKNYVKNNTALQAFYKKMHFTMEDYDDMGEYIESQSAITLSKYDVASEDDYTQYVGIDSLGNSYIFRATSAMKYTAILDTYTIDIPEFIEKYENANTQERVVLNINKFMLAINNKDYKYAYSTLADSFKKTNFPTLESFETYAKQTFFDQNAFDYGKYDSEGETYYTYNITITDSTGREVNEISKTFIIQLNEGTDFALSFNK